MPWVVIVAMGGFLVGRQLFLRKLAVDCKTPKHIISKKMEYVTLKLKIVHDADVRRHCGLMLSVLVSGSSGPEALAGILW